MSRRAGKIPLSISLIIVSTTWLALGGCAGRGGQPPASPTTPQLPSSTVDFSSDVQPIFNRNCSCHTTINAQGGLVLKEGLSYDALVGVASIQKPQVLLVEPGEPEASYLFLKIDPGAAAQGELAGDLMPQGLQPLGADDQETIRRWIEEGAAREAPKDDRTPPQFAGAAAASDDGPFAIILSWAPATDDKSGPGDISYLVYLAASAGAEDFTQPLLETAKGALTVRIEGLESEKTYFFVVRARDAARNFDVNTIEVSATTPDAPPSTDIDFDSQILPVLRSTCLGCHGGDSGGGCPGAAGLCVDSYESLVRTGFNGRVVIPGDASNSELVKRVLVSSTPRMPLDGLLPGRRFLTGEEIQLISTWINQGALGSTGGANRPPSGSAGGPYFGFQGEPINFACPDAFDPDGDALAFSWDFGDGLRGTGRFPTHAYAQGGSYTATLSIGDGQAPSPLASAPVTVRAVTGDVPKSATLQRVCGSCHGLRMTLGDGRRGLAATPNQVLPTNPALRYFPTGTVLEARPRSPTSWKNTILRMRVLGAVVTNPDRLELEAFLGREYATTEAGADSFIDRCADCHTPALSMAIPRSVEMWRQTVDRMVDRYGAFVSNPAEKDSIAAYLGRVMVGPPPAALEPKNGQLFVQRTCTSCHPASWALDTATGLPRGDLRSYEGARAIAGRMIVNGCGQPGVMESIAARRFSEIQSPAPEFVYIEKFEWNPVSGILTVYATTSSQNPQNQLTVHLADGNSFPMVSIGDGFYSFQGVTGSPGRIVVSSALGSSVKWHKLVPQ